MQIEDETTQTASPDLRAEGQRSAARSRWIAAAMATFVMLAIWAGVPHPPHGDMDGHTYLALANGQPVMKPFAFRFLAPALVGLAARLTGSSTNFGFLILGIVSTWTLLFGVLTLVLRRRGGLWFAFVLALLPFWLRTFIDFMLPDLPHATLCVVYLMLLRRRWWGWASVTLTVMYLTRESTLLIALIAIPVLWVLVGRRVGWMHAAAAVVGAIGSKLGARHALPNYQHMNDTLYMIGKIPWNLSKNVFGITPWSNTLPVAPPIRVWTLPSWIHAGAVHQVGYSAYDWRFQTLTFGTVLSSFGIGFTALVCLCWRTPLRRLLPRDRPYLWVAAIYGAAVYFLAPMLGAAQTRLLDYGWPLFLVYLPAAVLVVWRNAPVSTIWTLIGLNFIVAWTDVVQRILHLPWTINLPIYLCCNLVAAWLLLKTKPEITETLPLD